jgi:hypothetical protein
MERQPGNDQNDLPDDDEYEEDEDEEDNDELDDAVINADDTGMVRTQHDIAQEDLIGEDDKEDEEA